VYCPSRDIHMDCICLCSPTGLLIFASPKVDRNNCLRNTLSDSKVTEGIKIINLTKNINIYVIKTFFYIPANPSNTGPAVLLDRYMEVAMVPHAVEVAIV